jgi:hypothetical protein
MLESTLFPLTLLSGLLVGAVLGGKVAELMFGLETRADPFFIAGGAMGGTILALSAAAIALAHPL